MAYWNGHVFFSCGDDFLRDYAINKGELKLNAYSSTRFENPGRHALCFCKRQQGCNRVGNRDQNMERPLRTQYQQSEHKYEQRFGTQTDDSRLRNTSIAGNGGCCAGRLLFLSRHGCLEATDALSDSFAEFREFFGPEHKQGNSENNQQMHRLKKSF
jgi:hypothetical protein